MSNKSLAKALDLLEGCLAVPDGARLPAIARDLGIATPTAYRLALALQKRGYLVRSTQGRYFAGSTLHALSGRLSASATVAGLSRPLLAALARRFGCIAHFGIFEEEMVTYLVRAGTGHDVGTAEGTQLEAYCSAIGKVVLAALPEARCEAYLAAGPFTPVTERTIVDPQAIRAELRTVRQRGYAIDDGEIFDGLYCVAVPVHARTSGVVGAISLSMTGRSLPGTVLSARLAALKGAAARLSGQLDSGAVPS